MTNRRTFITSAAAATAAAAFPMPALAYTPPKHLMPTKVRISSAYQPGEIVILPKAYFLYFVTGQREAIRYGIDYTGIIDFIGEGAVQPAGIIPTMIEGSLPLDGVPVQDLDRAKAALDRSGITDPTLTLSYAADIAKYGIAFADIAAKIQSDLAEIGISVELNPESVQANLDNYRGGTLEMSVQWWGGTPHPSNSLPFTSGQLVGLRAGWAEGGSPELEELAAKAEVAADAETRIALYQEWQTVLNEVGPFIPLFQPPVTLVGSTTIEPLEYNPMWTVDLGDVRLAD